MHSYKGSCHCKSIRLELNSSKEERELAYRKCTCSFCSAQDPIYCADAQGKIKFSLSNEKVLGRYQFFPSTIDFLFCKQCSCYLGAIQDTKNQLRSVINIKHFPSLRCSDKKIKTMDFSKESVEERIQRRLKHWTPTLIEAKEKKL